MLGGLELDRASLASLYGYIADANGNFDWAEPDDEVHAFANDGDRAVGTYLLGGGSTRCSRVGHNPG